LILRTKVYCTTPEIKEIFINKTWFSLMFIKVNIYKKKQKVKLFHIFFSKFVSKNMKKPKIHPTTKAHWLSFGFIVNKKYFF
jgi:TRAP-type uncharacterized transport system substrate-binding protein